MFCEYLKEIREKAKEKSDISEHLETIFTETVVTLPSLIVELGVRWGTSTFVFERAARLCNARLISVDIAPCGNVCKWDKWMFIRGNDVEIAQKWRYGKIDVLFIDTSHLYEHTKQEINHYFPLLNTHALVMFHDTNCKWNNKRGVIRALEDYFGRSFNEKEMFVGDLKGWSVKLYPNCNGLMVIRR